MPHSRHVVFALTGDVRHNSRALKQLAVLSDLGCRVTVLGFGTDGDVPALSGVRCRAVPQPVGGGPRFFARAHRAFRTAALTLPAAVYHASDLYTLPALSAAARHHGGRLVYDARELYAYVAATAGRPWVRGFWRAVEGCFIRRADAVFTVSPSIAEHLARTYGIPPPPVLYNAPPRRPVAPSGALRALAGIAPGTAVILHQGQMRRDRGCDALVAAMADVRGAVLVFLGGGPYRPALEARVARLGLTDRVRFHAPVPPDALLPLTAGADVGVTLLEDTCLNHRYALPNKLFEYLMAGVPVLASALPEMRRVVEGHDVGCVVDPADRTALVQTLQHMIDDGAARDHWRRHIPAVFETFGWEQSSEAFVRTYERLLPACP